VNERLSEEIVFPIHSGYVRDWGKWEVIREVVQNAADEADAGGGQVEFAYSKGQLRVHNHYTSINRTALLFGKTEKADNNKARGQFGEGLKLAMLASVREDMGMYVLTGSETWTPGIKRVRQYGNEECLVVLVEKHTTGDDVVICIDISEEDWNECKSRLLFIQKPKEMVDTTKGRIILDEAYKGNIYSKGIFVAHLDLLSFGYDLDDVKLDRDRRLVNVFELQWTLGTMFNEAIANRPDRMNLDVYKLLRDGKEDTRLFHHFTTNDNKVRIAEAFREEYGEEAVPVANAEDIKDMERCGRKAVVNPGLSEALTGHLNADVIRKDVNSLIAQRHDWTNLTNEERDNLFEFVKLIDVATEDVRAGKYRPLGFGLDTEIPERLIIVDFHNDSMTGFSGASPEDRTVLIARRILTDRPELIRTLIREEAYVIGSDGKGYAGHVGKTWGTHHIDLIGRIWSSIFFRI
jgi:hypothetical protein